jgi:UTP--glucose-1-phosphate uridylyltransferase
VEVPRSRFAPVKTTNDLLVVRSDAYELADDGRMERTFEGSGPLVSLDDDFFKMVPDFEQRFPQGAPSLRRATRLDVEGDVTFGAGVVVEGAARVTGPTTVPDGEVLSG